MVTNFNTGPFSKALKYLYRFLTEVSKEKDNKCRYMVSTLLKKNVKEVKDIIDRSEFYREVYEPLTWQYKNYNDVFNGGRNSSEYII